MNCCQNASCANGIGNYFSKQAEKFLKRYQKYGLEKSQKNLVEGIRLAGHQGKSILEIGCGVGTLHGELLKTGAQHAVGIDISAEMIRYARQFMKENLLDDKVEYFTGDFIDLSPEVQKADITVLDKVICCYPEMENLVRRSLEKTGSVYAFTLPRNSWWIKQPMSIAIFLSKLFKPKFHPYFHDHGKIFSILNQNHFEKIFQERTFIWQTFVFCRN